MRPPRLSVAFGLGVLITTSPSGSRANAGATVLESAWRFVAPMSSARLGPSSATVGDRWFVGFGSGSDAPPASVEVYDPSESRWQTLPSLADGRNELAAAADPATGTVLFAGGKVVGGTFGLPTAEADLFDGTAWSLSTLLTPRYFHAAAFAAGKFVVSGGEAYNRDLADAEILDVGKSIWSAAGVMPGGPRYDLTMTTLSDGRTILAVGGGSGGVAQAAADLFDAATLSWRRAPPMQTGRINHAALLLKDGRVIVTGGISGIPVLSSTEIYDPLSSSWSPAAPMHFARFDHSMVLLPDGRVLVAGGSSDSVNSLTSALPSVEIYDSKSDTWTDAPSLQTARFYLQAAVLSDGVYVTAGANGTAMSAGAPKPGVIETDQILSSTERLAFVVSSTNDAALPSRDGSADSDMTPERDGTQAASGAGCDCRVASTGAEQLASTWAAVICAGGWILQGLRRRNKRRPVPSIGSRSGYGQ